ncbi:MAG: hypothetical protein Q9208_004174 [Pyrenodesmia sp. 3 TL-2023]
MTGFRMTEDLPPEVLLTILESLTQADVKQARLVCTKFAWYGAHTLKVDTIYLSPREMDMEVFDSITQHPIWKRKVRNVVFDQTQFARLSLHQYIVAFISQLKQQVKKSICPAAIGLLGRLVGLEDSADGMFDVEVQAWLEWNRRFNQDTAMVQLERDAVDRFLDDRILVDGFRQYWYTAQQQRNLMSKSWFDRACRGLTVIGTLHSVTVCNTWEMILDSCDAFNAYDIMPGSPGDCESSWDELFSGMAGDEGPDMVYKERQDQCLVDFRRVTLRLREDSYSGLSPAARTWPSTCLLPQGLALSMPGPSWAMRHMGISDGCFEVRKLGQLLISSNKLPRRIHLPGGWDQIGLSPLAFDTQKWPDSSSLSAVCGDLEFLDVKITAFQGQIRNPHCPSLQGLQSLVQDASALQSLSICMPFEPSDGEAGDEDLFRFSQIFPAVTSWQQPNLTHLNLHGLATSYRDLAGLLFINLPELRSLKLGCVQLLDGPWEDFVEGLCHLHNLKDCQLNERLLLLNNQYYPRLVYNEVAEEWEFDGDLDTLLLAISNYITAGGRHPNLSRQEPDHASAKYMVRLNRTLNELRKERQ